MGIHSAKAQDDVILYVDTFNYTVDPVDPTIYTIPVRVQAFTGVAGVDLTMVSQNMGATILDVQNAGNIPDNSLTVNLIDQFSFTAIFLDFSGTGITLNDDAIFFNMIVQIEGENGDCFPFVFQFLEVVKADDPGNEAPSQGIGGPVCLNFMAELKGQVFYPQMAGDSAVIDSSIVHATAIDSVYIDTADVNGDYMMTVEANANYTVMPMGKADEDTRAKRLDGVNVADLVAIIRHLLAFEPFVSPYQYIAADVNRDNEISIEDLVLIQAYLLGKIDEWPNNTYWRYVVAEYIFPDPTNPLADFIPEQLEIFNATGEILGLDFYGIKVGDANLSAY